VHGVCLRACENKASPLSASSTTNSNATSENNSAPVPSTSHGNGTAQNSSTGKEFRFIVVTECTPPLIVAAGLKHHMVCGEDLPIDILYNYESFGSIMLTILFSQLTLISDYATRFLPGCFNASPVPGTTTSIGALLQCFILMHMIRHTFRTLEGVNDFCRFMVLSSPFQWGPYLFAATKVTEVVVRINAAFSLMGHPDVGEGVKGFFWKSPSFWIGITILCMCVPLVCCVWVPLIALSMGAAFVACAYPHISCLLMVSCGVPACVFFGCQKCIDCAEEAGGCNVEDEEAQGGATKGEWLTATKRIQFSMNGQIIRYGEEASDTAGMNIWTVIFMNQLAVFTMAISAYFSGAAFLLYRTGNWSLVHDHFFNEEFKFEAPTFPDFELCVRLPTFFSNIGDLLSFARLSLPQLFDTSIAIAVFAFFGQWIEKILVGGVRKFCFSKSSKRN